MSDRIVVKGRIEYKRGGERDNQAGPIELWDVINTSGGTLTRGQVVVWDYTNTTADKFCVTTTTSAANINVAGMVYSDSIGNGETGRIQVAGPTSFLKVNGTTDIAKGDLLGTYTSAGIAAKTTGSGAFAVALEAYTANNSNGVIEAKLGASGGASSGGVPGAHTHASADQGGQLDWDDVWTDAVHSHLSNAEGGTLTLAAAADVTASAAQVNAIAGGQSLTAAEYLWARRLVTSTRTQAAHNGLDVIGVAPSGIENGASGVVACSGLQLVEADTDLVAGDIVKVGGAGRVTKLSTEQVTIKATVTGTATSFTQPGAPTKLEILQAADVEADRQRAIFIVGTNDAGVSLHEQVSLDGTDTSTPVETTTTFATVCCAYVGSGSISDQNVVVRATGAGATVVTIPAGTDGVGKEVATTTRSLCNKLTIVGPNTDATRLTVVGMNPARSLIFERVQLNGASPSKVTTTNVFYWVDHIYTGEFTNAAEASVKTDETVDTTARKVGVVVTAAGAGGNAQVLLKPNA